MKTWIDEGCYPAPVMGVDEVGRGPWAGPVMAVAVHVDGDQVNSQISSEKRWSWIQDSKKVSPGRRQILYDFLTVSPCVQWSVGIASVEEIDTTNIRIATLKAMHRAYSGLGLTGGTLLVDGRDTLSETSARVIPMIQGDNLSFSIATASILAKVYRDHWMEQLHNAYPMYGWHQNRGYGTAQHAQALQTHGITPHHRRSFAPIAKLIADSL